MKKRSTVQCCVFFLWDLVVNYFNVVGMVTDAVVL